MLLLLHGNKRPALLSVTPYFKNRELLRRTQTAPYQGERRDLPPVQLVPL